MIVEEKNLGLYK